MASVTVSPSTATITVGQSGQLAAAVSDAPDAFMNSVTYLQSYASQNQLMPLNKYISQSNLDMSQYSIGASGWKYTNGDQYALLNALPDAELCVYRGTGHAPHWEEPSRVAAIRGPTRQTQISMPSSYFLQS